MRPGCMICWWRRWPAGGLRSAPQRAAEGGTKNDPIDAHKLAELLRLDALRPVYHGQHSLRHAARRLSRSYLALVQDSTRVMNRIKALYRSRGIACAGREFTRPSQRASWIDQLPAAGVHKRAELLYQHLDLLACCAARPSVPCWRKAESTRRAASCAPYRAWDRCALPCCWPWCRRPSASATSASSGPTSAWGW